MLPSPLRVHKRGGHRGHLTQFGQRRAKPRFPCHPDAPPCGVDLPRIGGYISTRQSVGHWIVRCPPSTWSTLHIRNAYGISRLVWQLMIVSRECRECHLGELKATAFAAEASILDPAGTHLPRPIRVHKPEDMTPSHQADAVIAVPDNDAARLVAYTAASENGSTLFQAGSSPQGGQVTVHGPLSACLSCTTGMRPESDTQTANPCGAAEDSIVTTNMVCAGILCSELRA